MKTGTQAEKAPFDGTQADRQAEEEKSPENGLVLKILVVSISLWTN